jgi:hypothetical protein
MWEIWSNRNAESVIFLLSPQIKKFSKAFNLKLYNYNSFFFRKFTSRNPDNYFMRGTTTWGGANAGQIVIIFGPPMPAT